MANQFIIKNGLIVDQGGAIITGSSQLSGSFDILGNATITGSLNVSSGITGSLFGTSSWAVSSSLANTASYSTTASYAATASYFITSSITSASYASTASWALNYITSSVTSASYSATASYFITSSVTSASYAGTASNINGGAINYIPFFSGSTNLSSSILYQSASSLGVYTIVPSGALDISYGGATNKPTLLLGADSGLTTRTQNTQKFASIAIASYNNASSSTAIIQANTANNSSSIYIGGGTSNLNSVTDIVFYTAPSIGMLIGTASFKLSGAPINPFYTGSQFSGSFNRTGSAIINANLLVSGSVIISGSLYPVSSGSGQGLTVGTASAANHTLGGPKNAWYKLYVAKNSIVFVDDLIDTNYSLGVNDSGSLTYNGVPIATVSGSLVSSSFSTTSSLSLEGLVTASVNTSTITFTKGNGTTFDLTIAQSGSAASASYVSSSNVYGPYGNNSILSASYATTASWAQNFLTSSVTSASYAATASYFITSSVTSASYAATASYINPLSQSIIVTGSITVTGGITHNGQFSGSYTDGFVIDYQTGNARLMAGTADGFTFYNNYNAASASLVSISAQGQVSASGFTGSLFGTASWAQNFLTSSVTSASYVSSSNVYGPNGYNSILTSSYALTASYVANGSSFPYTGSARITGSLDIVGTTTISGSLLVSGSTIQIGNNTLVGNTVLSGSIVISASIAPGNLSASVNIYGDTAMTGFLRFNPYSTNINQTISASYVFVSGSTNDLYFSQNGEGYANVTRLRWLEGNLYTGLLNGGLITTQSSTVYQISSGSGIIVSLNASIATNPYPTVQYLNWFNLSASIAPLTGSYDQQFVAVLSNGTIGAQGTPYNDGDYNTKIPIGIVIHQNRSTINAVQTFPGVAYGWKQRSYDFIKAFGPLKISGYTLTPSGSSTRSLLLDGGTAWVDGRNYTVDPSNPSYIVEAAGVTTSKIYRYRQSGSGWAYDTNAGVGYTDIDPTQYSNNGVLTPVGTNDWTIQRVFYFPNSGTKALYIYYGNATYANESLASAGVSTEAFSEAPNTAANAIYVGYILLRNNADFTVPASYTIQAAGLFRGGGSGGAGGGAGATTLASLSDVSITSPTDYQPFAYNSITAKWENRSTISASLAGNANTSTTASSAGTASWAINFITSSVTSASYASTSSWAINFITSSVTSASYASTASLVLNFITSSVTSASYASTASSADSFNVRTSATASNLLVTNTITAQTLVVQTITSSVEYSSGSNIFGSKLTDTQQFTGSVSITGSLSVIGSINGSSFTGSLRGTASWAQNSLSASYFVTSSVTSASYATTASYFLNGSITSASYANTASWALNFITNSITSASYSATASYFITSSVTSASVALTSSNINPLIQNVTITGSLLVSSSIILTPSGSISVVSGSINALSLTGSHFGTSSWAQNSLSASYFVTSSVTSASYASTSSWALNFLTSSVTSASYAATASYFITSSITSASYAGTASYINPVTQNLTITGSLLVSSSIIVTPSGSISVVSGSITALSLTGSLLGTSSWAQNFLTSSVTSASYVSSSGIYGPYGYNSILTASYASSSTSASYALNGGVTQIVAGTNISISPTTGIGAVTINASAASSGAGTNTTASFSSLSTWTFNHNLNSVYVVIQTIDSNGNQIIPQNIALTNNNTATITFPTAESGIAIASLGGVGTSAATSSYVTPYETAWTAYTPVWTAASSNPAIGNGTIQGWYKLVGKTCFVRGNVAMGSSTTFGSGEWYISMPFTASIADGILMSANILDNTTAWYNATVNGARAGFNYKTAIQYQNTGGTTDSIDSTHPMTWTNSDRFIWNGSYEII